MPLLCEMLHFALNYMEPKSITWWWSCCVRQGCQQETVCLDGGRLNPLTKDDAHAISAIAKDQPATTKTGIF